MPISPPSQRAEHQRARHDTKRCAGHRRHHRHSHAARVRNTVTTSGGGYYSFLKLTSGGNYTVTPSGGENNVFTSQPHLQRPARPNHRRGFHSDGKSRLQRHRFAVNGQIAAGDPTQAQRVFRGGTPSDCGGRPFPGYNADPAPVARRYDQYTYVNAALTRSA